MPAYLKVVDRCSADYTFCQFWTQSNGVPSPKTGLQQLYPKSNVSLEVFNTSKQVNLGQQNFIFS